MSLHPALLTTHILILILTMHDIMLHEGLSVIDLHQDIVHQDICCIIIIIQMHLLWV